MTTGGTVAIAAGAAAAGLLLGVVVSRRRRSTRAAVAAATQALAVVEPAVPKKRPRSLWSQVQLALAAEGGQAILPAAFLAFAILDAIPIPTDVGYFYTEKWLIEHRRRLTPLRFWVYKTANYYGWDVTWYLFLFGVTRYLGRSVKHQAGLGLGIISAGAIATVLWKAMVPEARRHHRRQLSLPAPRRAA